MREITAEVKTAAGMPPRAPLGVVIAEPLPVVRAGIAALIAKEPHFSVVAEVSDADEALETVRNLKKKTDVLVLIGLRMHGEHDSYWLIRAMREGFPHLPTIACGEDTEQRLISRALFMGADGFMDKNAHPQEFLDGLLAASHGDIVLVGPPPDWFGQIAEGVERQSETRPVLTERECQVLSVASEGLTAREIGCRLGLAERTVTTHLSRIYGKLGVSSRVAAITSAARAGLVTAG